MTGLILKDFCFSRMYTRNLLAMIAVILLFAVFMDMGASYAPMMMTVYIMVASLGAYTADEASKWDRYALSLPLSRGAVVGARYLFQLLLLAGGMGIALALSAVAALVKGHGADYLIQSALTCGGSALAFLLINAAAAPVTYKLGIEKTRTAMLIFYMLPLVGVVLGRKYLIPLFAGLSAGAPGLLAAAAAVLTVCAYLLSWRISTAIYAKKEF